MYMSQTRAADVSFILRVKSVMNHSNAYMSGLIPSLLAFGHCFSQRYQDIKKKVSIYKEKGIKI